MITIAFCINVQIFAQPVTEELRVKGCYFKIPASSATTVSGSGVVLNNYNSGIIKIEANGTLIADGNVNNESGSSYQVDGGLTVKGNWLNNATASVALPGATIGTVAFQGGAGQTIGGTSQTVFEGLTINNANGVALTSNQTVSDNLSFTAGILSTGANRLDVTATADGMFGYGTGKYVFGNFRRYVSAGIDYNLPVGTATQYELSGLRVLSQTGLTYVDVDFTISNQNPPPVGLTVNGVSVDDFLDYGYWTFTPNGGITAVSYNVMIQSTGHTDKGGLADNYSVITDYGLGGGWQDLGLHSVSTQQYSPSTVLAKRQNLTTFGKYIVGHSNAPLYNPPAVTEELRVKGCYFKIPVGATAVTAGTSTDVNNELSGTITVLGSLLLEGAWNNSATVNISTALLQFQGSGVQTFGEVSAVTLKDMIINKSSNDLTLTGDIIVTNQLTLADVVIITGSNTLTM